MTQRKVLVTGMSGLIGGVVRKHLEGKYQLAALNRRPVEGVQCHQADISDLDAIQPAFEGVDVVVHLAAFAQIDPPWKDLLHDNIVGTYNVFEASRQAGVERIVYASSGAAVSNWEKEMPYSALVEGRYDEVESWRKLTHESPIRPVGLYGSAARSGEKRWHAISPTPTTSRSSVCASVESTGKTAPKTCVNSRSGAASGISPR